MPAEVSSIVDVLSWASLLAGSFFYAVGMMGLLRMPDLFTRLHAFSVAETLGVGFLILGMVLQAGFSLVTVKLLFILGVIVVTAPVASHALARAALHDGEKPLLADAEGRAVPTACEDVYPELADRLEQPLSSETARHDAPDMGPGNSGPASAEAGPRWNS